MINQRAGFTALDLTVACVTEVMWMFVLLDNSFMDMVFEYTLKFILSPVSHVQTCSMCMQYMHVQCTVWSCIFITNVP